jgi:cytochrome c-type biogenesis protein CcmH
VTLVAVWAACTAVEEVPILERRAQEVNKGVMCPVCPGESIDQSQNPLSVQMRGIVVEKLEQGWTKQQIFDFFTERYGPSVILEPPTKGIHLLAWLVPPLGLAAALVTLYVVTRLMVRSRTVEAEEADGAIGLSAAERTRYVGRIEALLASDGAEEAAEARGRSRDSGGEATG